MNAGDLRALIDLKGKLVACEEVAQCKSEQEANAWLLAQVLRLLDAGLYAAAGTLLWGPRLFDPRPSMVQKVWNALNNNAKNLLQGSAAVGKCLGKGTKVLMFDGSVKPVETIKNGDLLMGDDSNPRAVLRTISGRSLLYKVKPRNGDEWICNRDHILTLQCSENRRNGDGKTISRRFTKGNIEDISVEEFAFSSASHRKLFCQYSVGVEWPKQNQEFDPYIYGLWIGDGGVNLPVLRNEDLEIISRWNQYFESLGYFISENKKSGSNCSGWFARIGLGKSSSGWAGKKTNPFTKFVKSSFIDGEKRILKNYLTASSQQRILLLSGIIDTDGYSANCGIGVTTKYRGLADDIAFLARSLGMHASITPKMARIKSIGFESEVFVVYMSGDALFELELAMRHKIPKRKSRTNPILKKIQVESVGFGDYFGFTLDGNGRFLLADFTVTHNSYTGIVWHLLDYWRDPYFTSIKLISTTAGHAKGNTFGTMVGLARQALIEMPGVVLSDYIGMDPGERSSGISIVAIPDGSDGGKVLQGFHPLPRPTPHPVLGDSSRVRAFIDEAELVPGSLWLGVKNMLSSVHGHDTIKVTGAYNPHDISSRTASLAEPDGGWQAVDPDAGYNGQDEWTSKEGWHVTRLDAAKSENVIQRENIYPGFQTYEGYLEFMEPNDGNTPEAWTFGRGLYPPTSSIQIIIPSHFIETSRGEFEFIGSTVGAGGADVAVEGRDDAIYTSGRYGKAVAFNRLVINRATRKREYDRIAFTHPRNVAQADQQFILPKGTTRIVGNGIREASQNLGISPEWVCMDRTGNGGVPHDYLCELWGEVQGVDFNKEATDRKIMEQGKQKADELYDGIVTEVWFAMSLWMEFGYFALSPAIPSDPLEQELRSRRYNFGAKKLRRVEKKDDFKARFGRSPDRADSLSLFLHGIRMKTSSIGSMTGRSASVNSRPIQHGPTDVPRYI